MSLRRYDKKMIQNMIRYSFAILMEIFCYNQSKKVEQMMLEPSTRYAIVCDNLKMVYPSRDGNPPKVAVHGLSLFVPSGECFGMLGPNGAGKTSFINTVSIQMVMKSFDLSF